MVPVPVVKVTPGGSPVAAIHALDAATAAVVAVAVMARLVVVVGEVTPVLAEVKCAAAAEATAVTLAPLLVPLALLAETVPLTTVPLVNPDTKHVVAPVVEQVSPLKLTV